MEALSDSTVTRLCSARMVSPGFDEHLDHAHFVEVADVGDLDIDLPCSCSFHSRMRR